LGTPDLTHRAIPEPIREVWIHNERFAANRLSMMRIMARRMNATTVVALSFEVARQSAVATNPCEGVLAEPQIRQRPIA
jgi:hypothetical protein